MSLSGMPFNGMDVGGFTGPAPQPELFSRWVQNGILHPRFSIHSVNSDNTVTEPWLYPDLTETISAAIRLRYALLPTLYAAAVQAHEDGLPVARPLVFEFPGFRPGFDRHTEFLLGPALLAVAVTRPDLDEVEVCFPPGEWTDFYTGERVRGGRFARVPVPPDRSPLYYRSGHGFFLDDKFLEGKPMLIARLAMRADGSASFYDDDGRTRANESGMSLHSRYSWTRTERGLQLRHEARGPHIPHWPRLRLELDIGPTSPLRVTLKEQGGQERELHRSLHVEGGDADTWYYHIGLQRLDLELPASAIVRDWGLGLDLAQGMGVSIEPA